MSAKRQSTDGDPATDITSRKNSGGDASGPSDRENRSMRAEVLNNEESFFKIKLEDEIVIGREVIEVAATPGVSPLVGDMICVTFDASTKEVNKIYV